jgi:hypothetical protein
MPKKPFTDKSGVVPELTGEDLRGFRPPGGGAPAGPPDRLPRRRGAQVTLRLSREALAHVRGTGREAAAHP